MAKYNKVLELIYKIIDERYVTIEVKSERTAVSEMNKLMSCIQKLREASQGTNGFTIGSWNGKWMEDAFGDYGTVKDIMASISQSGILGKKMIESVRTIADYEKYSKMNIPGIDPSYPHYGIGFGKRKSDGSYFWYIEWVPSQVTQTSKEKTIVMLKELQEKVREVLGLYDVGSIPSNCLTYGKRDNVREWESQKAISNCQDILRDDYDIPPCSEKQKSYIKKILGSSNGINFYQAKELLEVYFNSEGIYNESDKEKIIDFYKNIMAKIKLTESRLKKMISEAVKTALRESVFKTDEFDMENDDNRRFFPADTHPEEYDDFEYDGVDYENEPWHKEVDMEWDEVIHGNPNVRNGGGQDAMDALGARGKNRERIAKTAHKYRFF